jgi:hypothetical protein
MYSWAPVPAQAAAVEDSIVGLDVTRVADLQPRLIAIEAVGVLHDELACSQHACAGAQLITTLDLNVVEDQRQIAVGANDLRNMRRHGLLVRQRKHQFRAAAVLELEQLLDRVAP